LDRQKHPVAVAMLADEPSEQDIHGTAWQAAAAAAGTLHLRAGPTERKLAIDKDAKVPAPDQRVYFQTAGDNRLRTWTTEAEFAQARDGQKAWLRKRWAEEGLPGTLTFHHVFSGELEVMLDHEAQRWGRSLSPGDVVHLTATPPIKAVVRTVAPWRERTLVRLVVGELASADLRLGQRLGLKRTPPPEAVDASPFPPDLGRPRSPAERVEWFLASTYCTCGVGKDVCTGHFYTLASCNPNGCGQPKRLRGIIAKKIEAGLTDLQIFEDLAKELGPDLLRPHLAP
jgi:hypothetical protein